MKQRLDTNLTIKYPLLQFSTGAITDLHAVAQTLMTTVCQHFHEHLTDTRSRSMHHCNCSTRSHMELCTQECFHCCFYSSCNPIGQRTKIQGERHAQMPERSEIENNFTEGGKDSLGSEKNAEHIKFVS